MTTRYESARSHDRWPEFYGDTPPAAPDGVDPDLWRLAAWSADLGVGHVWNAVACPAYHSFDPTDCRCTR